MKAQIFDTKKDFTELKYRVFDASGPLFGENGVKGLEKFTIANTDRVDRDKLIRYTMALYDKKSPLIKLMTDLGLRKKEAAALAGYDLDADTIEGLSITISSTDEDGEPIVRPATLEDLYDFVDPDLQTLVTEFLIDQNDFYWSMIVSNTQTFYEYQKALLSEVVLVESEKDRLQSLQIKGKLMDDCEKIAERVEVYYQKVFGDNKIAEKARSKNFTPESMARR
jgi:hypothetical protein